LTDEKAAANQPNATSGLDTTIRQCTLLSLLWHRTAGWRMRVVTDNSHTA
jgi:hypothetical protein